MPFPPSAGERLQALDRARAIPDDENAALIYAKLLADYKNIETFNDLLQPISEVDANTIRNDPNVIFSIDDRETRRFVLNHPWQRSQYPDIADAIDTFSKNNYLLLEAIQLPTCRFPLYQPPETLNQTPENFILFHKIIRAAIYSQTAALRADTMLDLGEQRYEAAISKIQILSKIHQHMCQNYTDLYYSRSVKFPLIQLLNIILLKAETTSFNYDAFKAISQSLYNEHYEINEDEIEQLKHKYYLNHVSDAIASNYWQHVLHCIRHGRWNQVRNYISPGGLGSSPQREELERQQRLFDKHIHQLILEARRFKEQDGHWPTRLQQIAPQLPRPLLDNIQSHQPVLIVLDGDCFIAQSQQQSGQDLLIADGKELKEKEQQFLYIFLENCFEILITTYERPKYGIQYDLEDSFRSISHYSTPILLHKLRHNDEHIKRAALDLLGKMADADDVNRSQGYLFLDGLMEAYHQEDVPEIQEHYLGILGCFNTLPIQQQRKLDGFLKSLIYQSDSPNIRTAAAMALLRANRVEGIHLLMSEGWVQNDNRFGKEGQWLLLQQIMRIVSSNYGDSWQWSRDRSKSSGYQITNQRGRSGLLSVQYATQYLDSTLKRIEAWWQENQDKLELIRNGHPNSSQLMNEVFYVP